MKAVASPRILCFRRYEPTWPHGETAVNYLPLPLHARLSVAAGSQPLPSWCLCLFRSGMVGDRLLPATCFETRLYWRSSSPQLASTTPMVYTQPRAHMTCGTLAWLSPIRLACFLVSECRHCCGTRRDDHGLGVPAPPREETFAFRRSISLRVVEPHGLLTNTCLTDILCNYVLL